MRIGVGRRWRTAQGHGVYMAGWYLHLWPFGLWYGEYHGWRVYLARALMIDVGKRTYVITTTDPI